MAFMDDLHGIFLVFGFSGEGKGIFLLAIGDLVDPEPFIGGSDKARQMSFDILDVIQLGCKGILNIITMTFQSVSPSSRRAMMPRTLTCLTWPT